MKTITILNVFLLLHCSITWSQCVVKFYSGQGLSGNCGPYTIQGSITQNAGLYGHCGGYQFTPPITDDDFSTSSVEVNLNEVSLFPNPVLDLLKIYLPKDIHISQLLVFDLIGREMVRLQINNISNEVEIDAGGLPSGYYIIKMYNNQKLITNASFLKF